MLPVAVTRTLVTWNMTHFHGAGLRSVAPADGVQADQADFANWEDQMAVDRSRGHFFKSLYQVDPKGAARRAQLQDPRVRRPDISYTTRVYKVPIAARLSHVRWEVEVVIDSVGGNWRWSKTVCDGLRDRPTPSYACEQGYVEKMCQGTGIGPGKACHVVGHGLRPEA